MLVRLTDYVTILKKFFLFPIMVVEVSCFPVVKQRDNKSGFAVSRCLVWRLLVLCHFTTKYIFVLKLNTFRIENNELRLRHNSKFCLQITIFESSIFFEILHIFCYSNPQKLSYCNKHIHIIQCMVNPGYFF